MSRMLHRRGKPRGEGQKAFIAVPAYEGLSAGFTYALFHTGAALVEAGIDYELAIYSGNCHIDDSRNKLVRDFLNSDCTDLVFLDADLGWHAGDFLKLLRFKRDVVAGVYPKKHGDDTYPVIPIPGEIWSDLDGLIEVEAVPTGFLRISRAALERLNAEAAHYNAKNEAASAIPLIFERQVHGGERWGGDYVFCRKWRAAGGRIYIAPDMRFEHSGEHVWVGSVGAYFRQRSGIGLKAGLEAIAAGRDTIEDLIELFDAWGNNFAANAIMLDALAMLAREAQGHVLECGSGISSLVMAAARPDLEIHALENSPVFAEYLSIEAEKNGIANIHIHCRPLKGGWYDIADLPAHDWALVVIDGPPRKDGNRLAVLDRIDLSRAVVVADDVQDDGGIPELTTLLRQTHRVAAIDTGRRSFAVCAPNLDALSKAA